jgi:5S rRNA maturation endonuclease (ribonuclease M5)
LKRQPYKRGERNDCVLKIEELIVVEGKNDAHAVRKALGKVDVIWTEDSA